MYYLEGLRGQTALVFLLYFTPTTRLAVVQSCTSVLTTLIIFLLRDSLSCLFFWHIMIQAGKIRSRTNQGHTRFLDTNDPTSTVNRLTLFPESIIGKLGSFFLRLSSRRIKNKQSKVYNVTHFISNRSERFIKHLTTF